jgi:hypothetical protein
MAPEGVPAVLLAPNKLCYYVCFFALFVIHLYIMLLLPSLKTEKKVYSGQCDHRRPQSY